MDPDDSRLLRLIDLLHENSAVDWDEIESHAADDATRNLIRRMRVIREIARIHGCDHPVAATAAEGARSPHVADTAPPGEWVGPAFASESGPQPAGDTTTAAIPAQPVGKLGGFRIVRKLGEGGMGIVYEAEQQNPKRPVALKVVRGGSHVDETSVRMFRREVQTLAHLRHPGIAAIYESGCTDDGQHYFAMELVRGETLAHYCKRRDAEEGLSPAEVKHRLQLFCKICDAIGYAHQRGVIHRDLKPANILVLRDSVPSRSGSGAGPSVPEIKVLDFGLARITESDVAVSTVLTDLGSVHGTLPYMSPEQVRGNPDEIDLRTDVYSLGVLLYEILARQLPLEVSRQQITEALRIICEEPPKPLARAWRGARKPDPDLVTIVHKAFDKEPSRRYQSVLGLAEDVQRYLGRQPILARPPSATYQLRKLVARHKAGFAFAVSLVSLLAGFAITMAVQASRIARERDRANQETETAEQVSEFLVNLFQVSDPSEARGNSITAREILDKGAERIEHELASQPITQARLLGTVGRVYGNLGLGDRARPMFERALDIRKEHFGGESAEVAESMNDLAWLLPEAEGFALHRRALEIQEKILPPDDPAIAWCLYSMGTKLIYLGKLEESGPYLERARAIFEKQFGPDHKGVIFCLNELANGQLLLRHYAAAESLHARVLEIRERTLPPDHPDLAFGLNNLGYLRVQLGDFEGARPLLERSLAIVEKVYGPEGPATAVALESLGEMWWRAGELARARPLLERALAIQEQHLRPGDWAIAVTLHSLACVLRDEGQFDESENLFDRALTIREDLQGTHRADLADTMDEYAKLLHRTGRQALADSMSMRARIIRNQMQANLASGAHD